MSKTWLIFDADSLANTAYYAMGTLTHNRQPTGLVFGFLRVLVKLVNQFDTHRVLFCFDNGDPKRLDIYPKYKWKRRMKTDSIRGMIRDQVRRLRDYHLGRIGFRNILHQEGYEADDVVASVVKSLPTKDIKIIVSSDKDLYQLLGHDNTVFQYRINLKLLYTIKDFQAEYTGMYPSQWPTVKAIAGCTSDDIAGVPGVGELSAIRYVLGSLSTSSKWHKAIEKHKPLWKSNLNLVTLPYPGLCRFTINYDEVTKKSWNDFAAELGMNKLINSWPSLTSKTLF